MTTSMMYIKRPTVETAETPIITKPNSVVGKAVIDRKVMAFLKTHPEFDWTSIEIRRGCTEIKRVRTVVNSLRRLVIEGKIVPIRRITGKMWSYQLPGWLDNNRRPCG